MKKLLLTVLLSPVYVCASYNVESTLKIENKTIERAHQVAEGDHVVYPCQGLILDATVSPVEGKDEYAVHLKIVHRSGATITEQDQTAQWGKAVSFLCPSDKATAELVLKVTQALQANGADQLESAAA